MILIFTHTQDLTADFVIRNLARDHIPFVRIDSDTLGQTRRHFGFDGEAPTLEYDGLSVSAAEVSAIWARRFAKPEALTRMDASYVAFATREFRSAMDAFIDSVPGLVVNTYEADRKAGNRVTQSMAAASVGLKIPAALVTQRPAAAISFVKSRRSIIKALSYGVLTEDNRQVAHTTPITEDDIYDLEFCPVLLQERIEKRREWRVTTVGSQAFSARTREDVAIDSVDWRRSDNVADIFENAELPHEIETRLLKLCAASQLHFGAHDLIEAPGGEFYFLETNPAGQWAWLELTLGLPIGRAVADLLANRGA